MIVRQNYLNKGLKITAVIVLLASAASQNWSEVFDVDNLDNYYYQQRLNQYPPPLARFGYYMEKYVESPIFVALRGKIFDLVDLRRITTN